MKFLDLTLPTPAENLACDEALLDTCETALTLAPLGGEGQGEGAFGLRCLGGILRFWESLEYFVVVGYGNKVADEVNQTACAKMNVPILRRCSGGGTVLQGPGNLNYSLILPFDETGPLRTITAANQFIMERNRAAIEAAISRQPSAISHLPSAIRISGHTDLTITSRPAPHASWLKFSGNSQRRRKHFLLFHGTFLLNFDLALIEKLLLMPTKQPDYRQHRAHSEFLTNLHLPADTVKQALQSAWDATTPLSEVPDNQIAALTREKYSTAEWNLKF